MTELVGDRKPLSLWWVRAIHNYRPPLPSDRRVKGHKHSGNVVVQHLFYDMRESPCNDVDWNGKSRDMMISEQLSGVADSATRVSHETS